MAIGVVGGGVAKCDECGAIQKFELNHPSADQVRAAAVGAGWTHTADDRLLCTAH